MMNRVQLLEVGRTFRTHGLHGNMAYEIDEQYLPFVERERVLFFMIDGDAVPYFLKPSCDLDEGFLQLEEIDQLEDAKGLANAPIYIDSSRLLPEEVNEEEELQTEWIGFELVDTTTGKRGVVTDIESFPSQILLVIRIKNKEFYLPLREEWIVELDLNAKKIIMQLPDGLLD